MKQPLYKGALNDACLNLAKAVLWTPNGVSNDVVETLAAKFQEEALWHLEFISDQGRDPNMLTRAVHYLADAIAIPPMGTDTAWFKEMLSCLIELAVPNSSLTRKSAEFLNDVQVGIAESLRSASE